MSENDHDVLQDRLELVELEGRYAHTFDTHDGEGWAGLFTESGTYQGIALPGMPDPVPPIRGREALAVSCVNFPGSGVHLLSVPQITLDGDRAVGRIHFQFEQHRLDEFGNSHELKIVAYYHATYVRTADGWRIHNRVTVPFSVSSTSRCGYQLSAELPGPDWPEE